jgi:hypothetical protein
LQKRIYSEEAVRAVIAVYQGKVPSPEEANEISERGSESTRVWKVAS